MKTLFLLIFYFLTTSMLISGKFYSINSGIWSTASNWSVASGGSASSNAPSKGDIIYIEGHDIILDIDIGQPGISLFISGDGSLTEESGTNHSLYIKTNGDLSINDGTVNVNSMSTKNGGTITIGANSTITLVTFVDNSNVMVLDGQLIIGTYLNNDGTISGNGTITAATFTGGGTTFGISPNSSIPAGSTIGGSTWTGTTSADWSNTLNWSNSEVPVNTKTIAILSGTAYSPSIPNGISASGYNLTVNSGATLTISTQADLSLQGNFTNNGNLIISSDATGTGSFIASGSLTGNGNTVNRFISQDIYHYISSPTTGQTITNLQAGTPNTDFDLFVYDEDYLLGGGPQWTDLSAAGGNLENGRGYAYTYRPNDRTVAFTGSMNNGDISIPVSYTYNAGISAEPWYFGWNLIGNPYPSRISATDFLSANTDIYGTLYFWDESGGWTYPSNADYATWNTLGSVSGGGSHTPNGKIEVGQAFFVNYNSLSGSTSTASSSVSFNNSMRTNEAAQFFKSTTSEKINLKLALHDSQAQTNELLIGFKEDASDGFDNGYDGIKFKGNPTISFYSILVSDDGQDYAIQGLSPNFTEKSVKIGFQTEFTGEYDIQVISFENMDNNFTAILEDTYEEVFTQVNETSKYTFSVQSSGTYNDRFLLHFYNTVGTTEVIGELTDAQVYSFGNEIIVSNREHKTYNQVVVYDLMGKRISSSQFDNTKNLSKYQMNLAYGFYIVELTGNQSDLRQKIFIKH